MCGGVVWVLLYIAGLCACVVRVCMCVQVYDGVIAREVSPWLFNGPRFLLTV